MFEFGLYCSMLTKSPYCWNKIMKETSSSLFQLRSARGVPATTSIIWFPTVMEVFEGLVTIIAKVKEENISMISSAAITTVLSFSAVIGEISTSSAVLIGMSTSFLTKAGPLWYLRRLLFVLCRHG